MKKYGYVYRGLIRVTCEANSWMEAVKIFDKMGYTLMGGDVVAL